MIVQYCPQCEEEYMPHVTICADCGAELVAREEGQGNVVDEVPAGLPPGHYAPILQVDRAAELEDLVRSLAQAGVPAKVQPSQRGQGFVLGVRAEDQDAAHEVLARLTKAERTAVDDGLFDAQQGYARCPACDTQLLAGAQECPECGLAVGGAFDAGADPEQSEP